MFFGPIKETGDVVEVKETTFEAFDTMVKYIYKPPSGSENPFNIDHISCPQKLFVLLSLATQYQIWKLAEMTSDALESLTITTESMIFTATVAKMYKGSFDDLSKKLTVSEILVRHNQRRRGHLHPHQGDRRQLPRSKPGHPAGAGGCGDCNSPAFR